MSKIDDLNKFMKAKQRTDADASRDGPQPLEIVNDITSIETNTQKITFTDDFVVTSPTAREVNVAPVKNKTQVKTLSADKTSTGVMADLTFNNLVIGREYVLSGQILHNDDTNGVDRFISIVQIKNGATQIGRSSVVFFDNGTLHDDFGAGLAVNAPFTATDVTVTFDYTSRTNMMILGNGSRGETYIALTELEDTEPTTDFT